MSNGDNPGRNAAEEASLFAGIMGGSDEPEHDAPTSSEGDQGEGDGREPEGHEETEAERQGRERDAQGRYAKPDPKAEGKPPQGQDRAQKGLRNEVVSERSKRQAEAARADALERQLGEMRAQMDMLARQQVAAPRQTQQATEEKQAPAAPDMWTDPEGYRNYVIGQAEQRAQAVMAERDNTRIRYSFEDAGQRHGDAFQAAYRALDGLPPEPANVATLNRIRASADPGEALVNWHKAHQARQEIGADPIAFRERIRAEERDPQKLMQDPAFAQAVTDLLRQQAGQGGPNGGPRTTYTPMPNLNGARGSNARAASPDDFDDSDRGVFQSAMSGPRNR